MLGHNLTDNCTRSFQATIRHKASTFHSSSALLDSKALRSSKNRKIKNKFSSGLLGFQPSKFYFPFKVTSCHVLSFEWKVLAPKEPFSVDVTYEFYFLLMKNGFALVYPY